MKLNAVLIWRYFSRGVRGIFLTWVSWFFLILSESVYINVVDVLCFTELCYTTTVPECLAVNQTHFLLPNAFGDMTLSAAVERFGYYKNESCSAKFMLYLCNMFFPTCNTSTGMMQFPCKSLCNGMHVHIKNNNFSHREYSMELLYQITVLVK